MFGLRDIERNSAPKRAAELPGMRQQGIMLASDRAFKDSEGPSEIQRDTEERDFKERLRELKVESSVPSMRPAEIFRSPRPTA